jgi:hypothetical protein
MQAIRLRGDAVLAAKVGAGMLGPLLPSLALLDWLGDRSFVAVLAVGLGGVLAALAPIPFVVAWRLSQRRLELVNGRLRVCSHKSVLDIGIDELEGFRPIDLDDGWSLLSFKVRGAWEFEDPRIFDKAGVQAFIAALRAARPELVASAATPAEAAAAVASDGA